MQQSNNWQQMLPLGFNGLKAQSYLKIIGVARRVAQGARAPSIEMPPIKKI